jgi:hypothetical protein
MEAILSGVIKNWYIVKSLIGLSLGMLKIASKIRKQGG